MRNFIATLAAIITFSLPSTLVLERVALGRTGLAGGAASRNVLFGMWSFFYLIFTLNRENVTPISYMEQFSSFSFFIIGWIASSHLPPHAVWCGLMVLLFHVIIHPRGRLVRMVRRRGMWMVRPIFAIHKFVMATIVPGIVGWQAIGVLFFVLKQDKRVCTWFPGMRLLASADGSGCANVGTIVPLAIAVVTLCILYVQTHLHATTITGVMHDIVAIDDNSGRGFGEFSSRKHMVVLESVIKDSFRREVDNIDPVVAKRDQSATAMGTMNTEDVSIAAAATMQGEEARSRFLDPPDTRYLMSDARRIYGGHSRMYTFDDTLRHIKKNGRGFRVQPYRWLYLRDGVINDRWQSAVLPPRMPFTFEDLYEADYNVRVWKAKHDRPPSRRKHAYSMLDFVLLYMFPTWPVDWMEIDERAIIRLRYLDDAETVGVTTKMKSLSRIPIGVSAVRLLLFLTAFTVPRNWTRTGSVSVNEDVEMWGTV
jgi:hypothetical protein